MGSGASTTGIAGMAEKEMKSLREKQQVILVERTISEVEDQMNLQSYSSWDSPSVSDCESENLETRDASTIEAAPVPPNRQDHIKWLEELDIFQVEAEEEPEAFLALFKDRALELDARRVGLSRCRV
eukprot:s584_g20.t1